MVLPDPEGEGVTRGARLAVDVGSVRVGLAASDPDGLVASPVETVPRDVARGQDVRRIAELVEERAVAVVYVGLPRHLSGRESSSSGVARTYAGELASAVAPVPVRLVDERMSTVSAHQALHAAGRPGRRHRSVVDQAAAVVILQAALDGERATGRRSGEPVVPAGGGQQTTGSGGSVLGTTRSGTSGPEEG